MLTSMRNYLLYEAICRGLRHSLSARRTATSRRERDSHLCTIVDFLDTLDAALAD